MSAMYLPAPGTASRMLQAQVGEHRVETEAQHRDQPEGGHHPHETRERAPGASCHEQHGYEEQQLRLGERQRAEDAGPAVPAPGPRDVGGRQRHKHDEVRLALQNRHEKWEETGDQRRGDDRPAAVDAQTVPHEKGDQRHHQQHVERGHRVIRLPVAQRGKGRDEERVVRRVEIREHDEPIRGLRDDLQLELLLLNEVIHGRAAPEDIQPGRRVKRDEVRTLKGAADQAHPEVNPYQ